ncbi:hypothetical protein LTS17_000181 [Exophiala oligosperma]
MHIKIDKEKADGSFEKYVMDTVYDGEEGSEVFEVPPHWHKYHDEYLTVLEGRIEANLEGKGKTVINAGDEAFFVPRWHVHSMKGFQGEKTVLRETAVPAETWGLGKALFFNDALGQDGRPGFWRLLRVAYDGDLYPPLPGGIKFIDQAFVTVLGFIAKFFVQAKEQTL